MALPPSGSHDAIELVKVETNDFSLVIKGKPYHERYEGLKLYQSMDFHDEMEFFVRGENLLDVKVFNVEKEELDDQFIGLKPIFFENGIYQLIIVPKTNREVSFYHEHPDLRQAVAPVQLGEQIIWMGNLQFQNEIGFTNLEVRSEKEVLLGITLEIFPVKLDYKKDYQKLLEEVNDEIYNLAFHFIRKTFLKARVKLEGNPSRTEFYRLIRHHFVQFIQAIERIEKQPHHQQQKMYEKARGDQLGKQDARTLKYLRKRPHLFTEVNKGIEISGIAMLPVQGLRIRKKLTHDTLENRYVKWMIERLIHKLTDLLEQIYRDHRRWNKELDVDLIKRIENMKSRLDNILRKNFWKSIGKLDRSMMSLVMQMAPGYRDAFQIYLTVSKGLALQGSIYQMSVKDVAVLYEYWTFLKMGSILSRKYEMISQDIIHVNRDGLFVNLQSNRKAKRVFRHPVTKEEITLTYQNYHGSLPTTSQIPDTMLKIEKKGKDYTFDYIFDAKYRIDYAQEGSSYYRNYKTPGPMEEDINTMHRYRDAIVSNYNGPFERTSFGAYVLFPWNDEVLYQDHHFYKSIDQVNIGGLPFLPNATVLVERFIERLVDNSAEELHKEGILPRGSIEEWRSTLDDKVLVGLVTSEEDYIKFIQDKQYMLNINYLRKDWQEAKYVALYVKKGVMNQENGVTVYGKIQEVTYIDDKVRFHVDYWMNLPHTIKPVHYGIATYIMTTIDTLKEAKELPELFMKSKDEMILWRMLRRVSDRIKLDLNDPIMDHATRVKEYRIKEIRVKLERKENKLVFVKKDIERSIDLYLLDKNPTAVFKVLMEFVQL